MKSKNAGFLFAGFWLCLVVLTAAVSARRVGGEASGAIPVPSATGQVRATAAAVFTRVAPTATPTMTPTATVVALLGVETARERTVVYTFRLDETGRQVWSEDGAIQAGQLMKGYSCNGGYRQVEFLRDGWWAVRWAECEE